MDLSCAETWFLLASPKLRFAPNDSPSVTRVSKKSRMNFLWDDISRVSFSLKYVGTSRIPSHPRLASLNYFLPREILLKKTSLAYLLGTTRLATTYPKDKLLQQAIKSYCGRTHYERWVRPTDWIQSNQLNSVCTSHRYFGMIPWGSLVGQDSLL